MMTWKKIVAGAVLSTALIAGTEFAAFAADPAQATDSGTKAVHDHAHKQDRKANHVQLTQEQKDALKQAKVDIKTLEQTHQQIKTSWQSIKSDKAALKDLVKNSTDKNLKQQVRADLKPVRENFKQLKELRKQDKALHADLKTALQAKDTAKLQDLVTKLEANAKQELQLVQGVQKAVHEEVAKVQTQSK